jgi:hypothetical protein
VSRDAHVSVGVGSMGNGSFDQDRVVVEQIPESVLHDVGLRHLLRVHHKRPRISFLFLLKFFFGRGGRGFDTWGRVYLHQFH